MDFTLIKDILKHEKSKVFIVEDGKPSYVFLPVEEYRELLARHGSQDIERIENGRDEGETAQRLHKLEDLPF